MATFKAKIKGGVTNPPIFNSGQAVHVDIKFYMRRPNSHFKGDDQTKPLKKGLSVTHTVQPDVDDLVKFVLDGLNELVHQDDKAVVKLTVLKLHDSEGGCDGRTVVKFVKFNKE